MTESSMETSIRTTKRIRIMARPDVLKTSKENARVLKHLLEG